MKIIQNDKSEVESFLYKYVMNNNPDLEEDDIAHYEALNSHDLLIEYTNGEKEIFDTFSNTSRKANLNLDDDIQIKTTFKRQLQNIMNRKWVTQDELAKRIGTSQQMISRYLTGQSIPSAITLKKIATALHCDIDDFYNFD